MTAHDIALIVEPTAWHVSGWIQRLADRDDVARVYLSDPTGVTEAEARREFGERLEAVFPSPKELFNAVQPAAAFITLEPRRTPQACAIALQAGSHVLYEKPGAVFARDLDDLAAMAHLSNLQFVCAYANRMPPHLRYVADMIRGGQIGDVWAVNAVFVARDRLVKGWREYGGGWLFSRERGGGWLNFLGCHTVDLIRAVTGEEFTEVTALSGKVHDEPFDVDDTNAVAFRLSGGAFGTLLTGYDLPEHPGLGTLAVYGSQGWLITEPLAIGNPTVTCHAEGSPTPESRDWSVDFYNGEPVDAYRLLADAFMSAVRGEGPTPCEPEAGARVLTFTAAAQRAAESRQTRPVAETFLEARRNGSRLGV